MKSNITDASSIATPAKGLVDSEAQAPTTPDHRVQPWRQWLVNLTLVISDIWLASLLWGLALVIQSALGEEGQLSELTVPYILFSTALWVGMRALLGLYPGYGLDPAEELRRQTYATAAALAITATIISGFQVGEQLSRLLVGVNFLELLVAGPLWRHFVKRALMKLKLWGKPVVILGAGETGKQLTRTLQKEWGLGFKPAAVFDFHLAPRGGYSRACPTEGP